MTKAVFDPTGVNGDVFSMGNMVETATAKIMTDTERTRLAGMASGATANIGTVTSVAVAVPAGLAVTGAITTSGTITISYAAGYQGYTPAEANKLNGINLALYQTLALKGLANGYAGLDAAGKVPTTQLPDTVLGAVRYIGVWDAATNSPAIPAASAANKGWYYMVSVTGATNIDGNGDWIVSNGTRWDRVKNVDAVISVADQCSDFLPVFGSGSCAYSLNEVAGTPTGLPRRRLSHCCSTLAKKPSKSRYRRSMVSGLRMAQQIRGANECAKGR